MHFRMRFPRSDVDDAVLKKQAVRLAALAADLQRIASGDAPSAEELAAAPVLSNWILYNVDAVAARGIVQSHPILPDGPCWTSEVAVYSPRERWVRTLSRWYVLGDPAPTFGGE